MATSTLRYRTIHVCSKLRAKASQTNCSHHSRLTNTCLYTFSHPSIVQFGVLNIPFKTSTYIHRYMVMDCTLCVRTYSMCEQRALIEVGHSLLLSPLFQERAVATRGSRSPWLLTSNRLVSSSCVCWCNAFLLPVCVYLSLSVFVSLSLSISVPLCHYLMCFCLPPQFGRQHYTILRPFKEIQKLIDNLSSCHGAYHYSVLVRTCTCIYVYVVRI